MTPPGRAVSDAPHGFSVSNAIQIFTLFATLIGLLLFLAAHRFSPYTSTIADISASIPAFGLTAYRVHRMARCETTAPDLHHAWQLAMATTGKASGDAPVINAVSISATRVFILANPTNSPAEASKSEESKCAGMRRDGNREARTV